MNDRQTPSGRAGTTWLAELAMRQGCAGIDDDELLEIAAETDPLGPLAIMRGMLNALAARHEDRETQAAVAALLHYHLPNLVEVAGYSERS